LEYATSCFEKKENGLYSGDWTLNKKKSENFNRNILTMNIPWYIL
jgi:hypothetical protein